MAVIKNSNGKPSKGGKKAVRLNRTATVRNPRNNYYSRGISITRFL